MRYAKGEYNACSKTDRLSATSILHESKQKIFDSFIFSFTDLIQITIVHKQTKKQSDTDINWQKDKLS